MKLAIAFTRLAQTELNEAVVYLGERAPRAALATYRRIQARIELLREQPEIGRIGQVPGIRELVVHGTRYVVIYRIQVAQRRIEVLRVLHTSRDPERA